MTPQNIILIGAPVDSGKDRKGCIMGPDAFRTARLGEILTQLGHSVTDLGNLTTRPPKDCRSFWAVIIRSRSAL
jgi:arginase